MGFAVSTKERAIIRKAAKAAKMPLSEYIRNQILEDLLMAESNKRESENGA